MVSQLFNGARHVGRLKLGSKPAQIYVRLGIIPLKPASEPCQLGNYKASCSSFRRLIMVRAVFLKVKDTALTIISLLKLTIKSETRVRKSYKK